MILNNSDAVEVAPALTSFADDLTDAADTIFLRHGIRGSWIDRQLDLWRVLADAVMRKERTASRSPTMVEFLARREMFLSELTEAAYRTALHYGLHGSFLEHELDLDLALREVIERLRSRIGLHVSIGGQPARHRRCRSGTFRTADLAWRRNRMLQNVKARPAADAQPNRFNLS